MDFLFRLLSPKKRLGIIVMGVFFIVAITLLDIAFAYLVFGEMQHGLLMYILSAICVGGPFVVLFIAATRYQLKSQRHLSLLSRKDGLTGLNNRRTFMDLAQRRLDEAEHGVLLLLDADHFKAINDKWGHAVGDKCLEQIAYRLTWNLRPTDVAGRLGGEEFAVLLNGANLHQARVIGDRLGQPIPFRAGPDGDHLSVTLSMGAILITPDVSLDTLLARADQALYIAKKRGRAQLVTWDETMLEQRATVPEESAA